MPLAMTEPSKARVQIQDDVVFGTGGRRELRCDVFTPPEGVSNRTGLLLVHGGGWENGDRKQLRGYGILLGRIGYTCVACEYRLSGEAPWPAQLVDVKAALRWMRANSARLGIDADRIAVSGNSAGAPANWNWSRDGIGVEEAEQEILEFLAQVGLEFGG